MTNTKRKREIRSVFFGSAPLAASALEALEGANLAPARTIFSTELGDALIEELAGGEWDCFIVASYGKLLPTHVLEIPRRGTLNIHPSLLPRLRGPSPIRSSILFDEREVGVSIILLDDKVDHGPLLAQKKVALSAWPPRGRDLDSLLAREGGKLLADVLPLWLAGEIEARPQNHDLATYCRAFTKDDGRIDLSDDPYHNLLKVRAFEGWPGTFTYFERAGKKLRVQILEAHLDRGKFSVDVVKPEGKKEMPYADFLRSGAVPARAS